MPLSCYMPLDAIAAIWYPPPKLLYAGLARYLESHVFLSLFRFPRPATLNKRTKRMQKGEKENNRTSQLYWEISHPCLGGLREQERRRSERTCSFSKSVANL